MKPAPFDYVAAETAAEAVSRLAQNKDAYPAGAVTLGDQGFCSDTRIVLLGVAPGPHRARAGEELRA